MSFGPFGEEHRYCIIRVPSMSRVNHPVPQICNCIKRFLVVFDVTIEFWKGKKMMLTLQDLIFFNKRLVRRRKIIRMAQRYTDQSPCIGHTTSAT